MRGCKLNWKGCGHKTFQAQVPAQPIKSFQRFDCFAQHIVIPMNKTIIFRVFLRLRVSKDKGYPSVHPNPVQNPYEGAYIFFC